MLHTRRMQNPLLMHLRHCQRMRQTACARRWNQVCFVGGRGAVFFSLCWLWRGLGGDKIVRPMRLLIVSSFLYCVLHVCAGKPGSVSAGGKSFDITPAMVEIKRVKKKLAGRNFVPSVIEPSFGIGRILYCIFEHSYYTREVRVGQQRCTV